MSFWKIRIIDCNSSAMYFFSYTFVHLEGILLCIVNKEGSSCLSTYLEYFDRLFPRCCLEWPFRNLLLWGCYIRMRSAFFVLTLSVGFVIIIFLGRNLYLQFLDQCFHHIIHFGQVFFFSHDELSFLICQISHGFSVFIIHFLQVKIKFL